MPVGEKKKQFSIVHLTPSFASICFDRVGVERRRNWVGLLNWVEGLTGGRRRGDGVGKASIFCDGFWPFLILNHFPTTGERALGCDC